MGVYDQLLDGKKMSCSISLPIPLMNVIGEYATVNGFNFSQSAAKLIRLGFTYTKLLQAQRAEKEKETQELEAQMKASAKTPSKKKKKKPKKL